MNKPVVARLIQLIRLRNEHPAFGGVFSVLDSAAHELKLRWQCEVHRAELQVDLKALAGELTLSDGTDDSRSFALTV